MNKIFHFLEMNMFGDINVKNDLITHKTDINIRLAYTHFNNRILMIKVTNGFIFSMV